MSCCFGKCTTTRETSNKGGQAHSQLLVLRTMILNLHDIFYAKQSYKNRSNIDIFIFDGTNNMNNMSNMSNLNQLKMNDRMKTNMARIFGNITNNMNGNSNNVNSVNSLTTFLNDLNSIGNKMCNIGNRTNGVNQEKFGPNVFGNNYGGYNSHNNDNTHDCNNNSNIDNINLSNSIEFDLDSLQTDMIVNRNVESCHSKMDNLTFDMHMSMENNHNINSKDDACGNHNDDDDDNDIMWMYPKINEKIKSIATDENVSHINCINTLDLHIRQLNRAKREAESFRIWVIKKSTHISICKIINVT